MRLHGDVVRGGALVPRLRRLQVLGAGAPVAQHAAALDQPLALLVYALGERQHGQVEAFHALEREVLELIEAEVARVRARVHFEVARAAARVRWEVARGGAREGVAARVARVAARAAVALGLVERVLARSWLQLDGLGVAAQVARGDEHARVGAARLRLLRVLRVGALQLRLVRLVRRRVRARLQGRRRRRARPGRHA